MSRSTRPPLLCRHCGAEVVGCVETRYGLGWVHAATRRERCARRDGQARKSGTLAMPAEAA